MSEPDGTRWITPMEARQLEEILEPDDTIHVGRPTAVALVVIVMLAALAALAYGAAGLVDWLL